MAQCYRKTQGVIKQEDGWGACSNNANMCCDSGDLCLDGGICWSPNNATNKISYYVSGCTDSTYKNSACIDHCGNETFPNIKWQTGTNVWACCGAGPLGQPDCTTLSSDTFSGPSQSQLDQQVSDMAHHVVRIAGGIIAAIVIAAVLCLGAGCFCLWRCCFSRHARDKRNRGKFIPLGNTNNRGVAGHEDVVWNANVHDNHDAGYGQGGAPYTHHGGPPQYTVGQFR